MDLISLWHDGWRLHICQFNFPIRKILQIRLKESCGNDYLKVDVRCVVSVSQFDLPLILGLHDINEVQFLDCPVQLKLWIGLQKFLLRVSDVDFFESLY